MNSAQNSVSSENLTEKPRTENQRMKLLTKESNNVVKNGWLTPYIEKDLTKTLRSSEKVELWLRAHFSHPMKQPVDFVQDNEGLQYGAERTNAAESVLTSLAALGISSGIFSALQEEENSSTAKFWRLMSTAEVFQCSNPNFLNYFLMSCC